VFFLPRAKSTQIKEIQFFRVAKLLAISIQIAFEVFINKFTIKEEQFTCLFVVNPPFHKTVSAQIAT